MPVLNGFEATAILREDSITTPIIGVTAYTTNDDRTRVLQAGCDAYLPKPIGKTELLNACAEQLHLREQRTINEAA
jgi:CheY-like chemotaxis protein